MEERIQRRLAAIAVVDVVGYSRLMESDEAGTLARLTERRKTILEPVVRNNNGRIVKFMGDGALLEFSSAVDAVSSALKLQKEMQAANSGLDADRHITLRIGINLGDIISQARDVFGDCVNVAARLQAQADPGGIFVSAKVRDEAKGKLADVAFEDMGQLSLKNITEPVHVFKVQGSGGQALSPPALALPDKPSVAVLPFTNMSAEAEKTYFSDGITEDIITELSRSRSLFVIARNSSFQYRDKLVDVRRIGRDLGVRYVVEGSVRVMGERIRITAQLIEASSGTHLWSERYDRGVENLFDVQDEVVQTIVGTISGRLESSEIATATRKRTDSPLAYDCLLRGIRHLRGYGPDDNRRSRELFEQAAKLDPDYALAHAYLALALIVENGYGAASDDVKQTALDAALKAVRLDPIEARCHTFLGQVYRFRDQFDLAISHLGQGVALNPNDAIGLVHLSGVLAVSGRPEEGMEIIKKAIRLDPYVSFAWGTLAMCHYLCRRYEEALEASRKVGGNKSVWQRAREAACLAQLGRSDEAKALVDDILRRKPNFSIEAELPHYKFAADAEHLREGLLRAGLPA